MKESVAIAVANECGTSAGHRGVSCDSVECTPIVQKLFSSVEKDDYFHAESIFRNHAAEMDAAQRRNLIEEFLRKLDLANRGEHVAHMRFAGHLYKICGEWKRAKCILQHAGTLL